jgi:hypothetical protein
MSQPTVTLIFSRKPDDIPAFNRAVIEAVSATAPRQPAHA